MSNGYLYNQYTLEQTKNSLAAYIPDGRATVAKNIKNSVFSNLLTGLSTEILRAENLVNEVTYQHNINNAVDLIEQWESALGIPDGCFQLTYQLPLQQRQTQVLTKLTSLSVSTEADYIRLANILIPGVSIRIEQVINLVVFPLSFPCQFSSSAKEARFTMIVHLSAYVAPLRFPLTFPVGFSSGNDNIIECIFNKVKPAVVRIIFIYDLD
jgi:uncharacterized protein YmfQ (DUF2313 family)